MLFISCIWLQAPEEFYWTFRLLSRRIWTMKTGFKLQPSQLHHLRCFSPFWRGSELTRDETLFQLETETRAECRQTAVLCNWKMCHMCMQIESQRQLTAQKRIPVFLECCNTIVFGLSMQCASYWEIKTCHQISRIWKGEWWCTAHRPLVLPAVSRLKCTPNSLQRWLKAKTGFEVLQCLSEIAFFRFCRKANQLNSIKSFTRQVFNWLRSPIRTRENLERGVCANWEFWTCQSYF